jgi:hypothetical protein
MPRYVDILAGSRLRPQVELSFGWLEAKTATFYFTLQDSAVRDLPILMSTEVATFNGNIATCTSQNTPPVPAGHDFYYIVVRAMTGSGAKAQADDIYRVYPSVVDLELVPVDGAGTPLLPMRAVPYTVSYDRGGATARNTSAVDGRAMITVVRLGGRIDIAVPMPWTVTRWVTNSASAGRTRSAEVRLFEAGFVTPAPGAKLEWAVNRATTNAGADRRGQTVTITVARKGEAALGVAGSTAVQGAVVYIVATFSKTTANTDHDPKLKRVTGLVSTNGGKTQTGRVTIGANKIATFDVDLGFAGGETCKLEIGTEVDDTGALTAVHETLDFENWREIEYDLLIPLADGADRLSDCTVFKSKTVAALPDDTVAELKTRLDPVKVRLVPGTIVFGDKTKFDAGWNATLFDDGAIFGQGGKKVFVLGAVDRVEAMDLYLKAGTGDRLRIAACDHVGMAHRWTQRFDEIDSEVTRDVVSDPPLKVIDRVIDTSMAADVDSYARGAFPIRKLTWTATQYRDNAAPWDEFPTDITTAGDPGGDSRTGVELTDKDDILAHLTFAGDKISFKFPRGKATFPGERYPLEANKLTCTRGATKYTITISIQLEGVGMREPLGAAALGDIVISSGFGTIPARALALIIAHEVGHCMGQAYGGRATPTAGIPLPAEVPGGHIYSGKGHQGYHCANGVLRKDELKYTYAGINAEAVCVMFGQRDQTVDVSFPFCSFCITYVLAENLSNIRRNWRL